MEHEAVVETIVRMHPVDAEERPARVNGSPERPVDEGAGDQQGGHAAEEPDGAPLLAEGNQRRHRRAENEKS